MADQKWVYTFQEVEEAESHVGGVWEKVRGLLGGKGANLVDATRLGIPVEFTNDGIRGPFIAHGTSFPAQLSLGSTWNRELIAAKGFDQGEVEAAVAGEAKAVAVAGEEAASRVKMEIESVPAEIDAPCLPVRMPSPAASMPTR